MLASARSPALRMTGTAGIRHHDWGNDSGWRAEWHARNSQADGRLATPPSSEQLRVQMLEAQMERVRREHGTTIQARSMTGVAPSARVSNTPTKTAKSRKTSLGRRVICNPRRLDRMASC